MWLFKFSPFLKLKRASFLHSFSIKISSRETNTSWCLQSNTSQFRLSPNYAARYSNGPSILLPIVLLRTAKPKEDSASNKDCRSHLTSPLSQTISPQLQNTSLLPRSIMVLRSLNPPFKTISKY